MRNAIDDPLLTPVQVAVELQVTPAAIYKWIKEGKLNAVKIGSRTRIRRSAIDKFIRPIEPHKEK